jgi:hypothetical protein
MALAKSPAGRPGTTNTALRGAAGVAQKAGGDGAKGARARLLA